MPPKRFVKSSKFRSPQNRGSLDERSTFKKASLAIEGLPILDYPSYNNHEAILRAEKLFTSYVEKLYPYNGKIFKEGQRFVFDNIEEPNEPWNDANDPNGIQRRTLQKRVDKLIDCEAEEKSNRIKVYSIIWNQLTPAFQQKAQEDEDFEEIESGRDDLRLWILVQSICLGMEDKSTNIIKRKHQAKRYYESIRQFKGESVYQYKERFIACMTRLSALEIDLPTDEEQAIVFIDGLDDTRFASWKIDISNSQLRGVNIYPETLNDAAMQASNFKVIMQKSVDDQPAVFIANAERPNKKPAKSSSNKKDLSKIKCFNCQKLGHYANKCPNKSERESALKEVKEESMASVKAAFVGSSMENEYLESMGFMTTPNLIERNPNIVFLDNCAQVSIFCNANLLQNIHNIDEKMKIAGVGGQAIHCDKVGYFKGIRVYYNQNALGNVLCQYDIMKSYKTSWVEEEQGWRVDFNDRAIIFKPIKKMWGFEFKPKKTGWDRTVMINEVEENKLPYSKSEVQKADGSRDLLKKLFFPSIPDLKKMVSDGSIINCPITIKDINNAETIYGKDIASLKGKSTRRKSVKFQLTDKNTQLGDEFKKNIVISADNFFIRGLKFLLTVNTLFNLIVVKYLPDSKSSTILSAIEGMIKMYASRSFKIDTIIMDGEQGLQSNKLEINGYGIQVNVTGKGKHASKAERTIRLVKERIRAYISTLPYILPDVLMIWLVYAVVFSLNNTPSMRNPYGLAPRILFDGRKLNFNRDLKSSFGEYVQVNESNDRTSDMKERTRDAIFLKMRGNGQGTAEFLDLRTWKIIGRDYWTNLPMPSSVVDLINSKAKLEGSDKRVLEADNCEIPSIDSVDNIDIDDEPIPDLIADYQIDEELIEREKVIIQHDDNNDVVNEVASESTEIDETIVEQLANADNDESINQVEHNVETPIDQEGTESQRKIESRYPKRDRISTRQYYESRGFAYNYIAMSIQEAAYRHGKLAYLGAYKEVKQIIDKEVFKPVRTDKKKLPCRLFLTPKSTDLIKGRLVGGGHRQDRSLYSEEDTYAATVATHHLFCIASIAGAENRFVITVDIVGAYLNAEMNREDIYMHIKPDLASYFFDLKPEWKEFANDDGSFDVQVLKAIYGCIESAHLFTEHATNSLKKIGFVTNPYDPCILNKISYKGNQITIAMHSDDWMITCVSEEDINEVVNYIKDVYREIKVKRGKEHNYLGMKFTFGKDEVLITMEDYINSITEWWGATQTASTPASNELFHIGESAQLSNELSAKFHSGVAKCLYLAKRARPDILTAVAYLTTRVQSPNESDYKKLDRLFKYLNGTTKLGLRLTQKQGINVMTQIDASFAVHPEFKSHGGSTTSIGEGTIYAKSSKLNNNTKSSTESELVSCSDHAPMGINMRNFLICQGYKINPVVIGQDNQSTIQLINRGRPASLRTRHINIRFFFLKDLIDRGEVLIKYVPTTEMIADIMTKPLQGHQFLVLRRMLLNEA